MIKLLVPDYMLGCPPARVDAAKVDGEKRGKDGYAEATKNKNKVDVSFQVIGDLSHYRDCE